MARSYINCNEDIVSFHFFATLKYLKSWSKKTFTLTLRNVAILKLLLYVVLRIFKGCFVLLVFFCHCILVLFHFLRIFVSTTIHKSFYWGYSTLHHISHGVVVHRWICHGRGNVLTGVTTVHLTQPRHHVATPHWPRITLLIWLSLHRLALLSLLAALLSLWRSWPTRHLVWRILTFLPLLIVNLLHCPQLLFQFHPSILKPNLDLPLSQAQGVSNLDPASPCQIVIEMELFL